MGEDYRRVKSWIKVKLVGLGLMIYVFYQLVTPPLSDTELGFARIAFSAISAAFGCAGLIILMDYPEDD